MNLENRDTRVGHTLWRLERRADGKYVPSLKRTWRGEVKAIVFELLDLIAGLVGAALRDWRRTTMTPIKDSLKRWMVATKPTLVPSDPLAAVIRYYENHWDALFRFVDNPLIPIDNSASEREFQNVAELRLNMLFAGGTEGALRAATLLGVTGTCRAIGVNPQAYLAWVFDRLGTHRDVFNMPVEALTPAAFKALRSSNTS